MNGVIYATYVLFFFQLEFKDYKSMREHTYFLVKLLYMRYSLRNIASVSGLNCIWFQV